MKNCSKKKKYQTFTEANKIKNITIGNNLFSTLNSYWCERHKCVHLGHSNRMDNKTVLERQFEMVKKCSWLDHLVEID